MQIDEQNDTAGVKAIRSMAELSEEMIMEILLRLPARTLCCMKSVCRLWRALISTRDFTWNHLRRSSSRPIVVYEDTRIFSVESLLDNPSKLPRVSCLSGLRGNKYSICGSCHGLLCLFNSHPCGMYAVLLNPCTGFRFKSPDTHGHLCFSGFGYDHLSDTFKFLGIIRNLRPSRSENTISTRIYTFGPTSSWRRIDDDVPIRVLTGGVDDRKGTYLGSSKVCTINWIVYRVVLYFDLGKETYGQFPLPHRDSTEYNPESLDRYLCVLRNCLSVCYEDQRTGQWIVWQMKEYGDSQSWTILAMIPFHSCLLSTSLRNRLKPLYISETDVLLAMSPSFRAVLFNLNNGRLDFSDEVHGSMLNQPCFRHWFRSGGRTIYIYHESLLSPSCFQSNSKPKRLVHLM
ncbi:hypothetical protein PIB30_047608 [Stylosanthes scabra]|uniref:F-box domain-containing protein n=1 Tax=Stylosanthes scabra TaxID=79078 RepID=A0ABU6QGC9_9FABA|nr:hypothetical protein [Stylosanthes scabra]